MNTTHNLLSEYLDYLNEESDDGSRFNPSKFIVGGTITTLWIIANLTAFLFAVSELKSKIKISEKWTKRINEILDSKKEWIVHVVPDRVPNAFAIGGKHVFITSELEKICTKREIEAILLHEIYHNKNKHVYKKLAAKYSLFYIIVTTGIAVMTTLGSFFLGCIIIFLLSQVSDLSYNRIVGRRYEIKSDEFAIQHGYGNELASSLIKLEKILQQNMSKQQCGTWCKIIRTFDEQVSEHPPTKKRIKLIFSKTKTLAKAMETRSFKVIRKFISNIFTVFTGAQS